MIRKSDKNFMLKYLFISVICLLLILIIIDSDEKEINYLDFNVNLKLSYTEKKSIADQSLDEINDYVSEVNDKGYPDYTIDKLYKNASSCYEDLNLDCLEELSYLIKERKDKVLEMNGFIDEVKRNINRYKNNERLNTSKFLPAILDIESLILKRNYDSAYDIALDIETDLELTILDYLFESEVTINELKQNNFTTVYVEDLLVSAKDHFSGAKTKELLVKINNENNSFKRNYATGLVKDIESKAYNVESVDYGVILKNTGEIIYRKNQLFEIQDMINDIEVKIQKYKNEGVEVSSALEIFDESLVYFKEENFDKANALLVETDTKLESARVKLTVTDIIARESMGFLKKYWKMIVIITSTIIILGYIFYRRERVTRLKRRLNNLKIEEGVLMELIKEAQKNRFVEQKISESEYKIKMEKYDERLNKVKEDIKTIKSILSKLTKKKTKKKLKPKNLLNKTSEKMELKK